MSDVILFPKHHLLRCGVNRPRNDRCDVGNCMFCSGGLAQCLTCGGAEGDLPSECPQERMHPTERAAVMNGHLDFRKGRWVCVSEEAKGKP